MSNEKKQIGFACAYTPLALIHAAGFSHYRILPLAGTPDQAGGILHDNLCPHVKCILDRAMSGDMPGLAGMVFMNSCDSMRRLSDAWQRVMPDMPAALIDLPVTANEESVKFFRGELARLADTLVQWGDLKPGAGELKRSIDLNNRIVDSFKALQDRVKKGELIHGPAALQELYTKASLEPMERTIEFLSSFRPGQDDKTTGVPVYLFGNVMPDPDAMRLFEECGARIIADDMCTGSRLFRTISPDSDDLLFCIARDSLGRSLCARTFDESSPGRIANDILAAAKESGASGVIGHTLKFCDPYIARMPFIRETLKKEGMPFLHLEGDCTVRSMGQQRTRIEAFIEMLG